MSDENDATKREGKAGSGSQKTDRAPQPSYKLTRGTLVGRYVILDKLGEGGMGIVYQAFDPELDRKVAIKVLQADEGGGSSGGEQAWLVREAQALARLAHPNVVSVHDVGTLPGDQVFVAMELVQGDTMRGWMKAKARTWREVVPIMRAAGAGLAAAHAAGLVHRDFKPENVLVGDDGRVRVMDFGLARLRPDERLAEARQARDLESGKSPLSVDLTLAGHVVGTPAYLAPEAYEGEPADARTDQFSFGVTLFEALYKQRPFDKEQLQTTRSAPPAPKLPAGADVPKALERIVLRAIAIDPKQRFASIDELCAELAIDPHARRRRILIAVGAVALVGAVTGGVVALARSHSHLCTGIDQRLAGVWDPSVKKAARDAFVATKLPFATQAFGTLESALDAYAAEWTKTATASCEATRVRGDQTEEILALRGECLDERLEELAAFTRVLAEPSKTLVEKGGKAASELPAIAPCSNVTALREPTKPPPEIVPQLRELFKQVADAKAQLIAGNYILAGAKATAAGRVAKQLGYLPAIADAEFARASTLMTTQSWDEAAKAFTDSAWAAMQAKRDDILAAGATSVAQIDAQGLDKLGEAKIWLQLAQAAAKRTGTDARLEIHMFEVEGIMASRSGDHAAAIAAHGNALAAAQRMFGKDSPLIWEIEQIYASTLTNAYEYAEAVPHYQHAMELRAQIVGQEHGDIALVLSSLGVCYRHLRDPRARPSFEHALALREKLYGKSNPILVPTLDNYGELLQQEGDPTAALAVFDRALQLATSFPGKDHPNYHEVARNRADALVAAKRYAEAHVSFDELLALEERTHSTVLPETLASRAELALAEHAWAEAADFAARAIAGAEAAGGADSPVLWRPLATLGRADVELRKMADARKALERAIEIGTRLKLHETELAPARDALARVPKD